VSNRTQAALLDEIARRYNTDPHTVLHWTPERIGLAHTCMQAAKERRSKILGTAGPDGSKPSVWVMMDVDTL